MVKLTMTRRMFIKMYELFKDAEIRYSNDLMFNYHLNLITESLEKEYTRLKRLTNGLMSNEMAEYLGRKETMVNSWVDLGRELKDLVDVKEFRDLNEYYKDYICEYDVNSNKVNSFLIEDIVYNVYGIPLRYIPNEIEKDLFEFLYLVIEEPIERIIGKVG